MVDELDDDYVEYENYALPKWCDVLTSTHLHNALSTSLNSIQWLRLALTAVSSLVYATSMFHVGQR